MANASLTHKEAHEQFVTGHAGTSVVEIAILATVAPLAVVIRNIISQSIDGKLRYASVCVLYDFLLLILPLILCLTVLADYAATVLTTFSVVAVTLMLFFLPHTSCSINSLTCLVNIPMFGKRPSITNYRAVVNVASAVCILAVDFATFPRRLCKTETYGTGLMDVGVASYVFANAVVAPEVRGIFMNTSAYSRIMKSVKSTAPLWILGFCRLVSVKATDYHEHITEYGLHWNFFFTLAVIRVLSTVIYSVVSVDYSWLVSLLVIAVYQTSLSSLQLADYILSEFTGRNGFINANREGIFSCFGYLALYCSGIQVGCLLFKPRHKVGDWLKLLCLLCVIDILFWTFYAISESIVGQASRRLTNLTYYFWMIAYNVQSLMSFLVADIIHVLCTTSSKLKHASIPVDSNDKASIQCEWPQLCLLEAINYNGLVYFLVANLLTGFINMTMMTIYASTLTALTVLTAYMLTLSIAVSVLYYCNIALKF